MFIPLYSWTDPSLKVWYVVLPILIIVGLIAIYGQNKEKEKHK